MNTTLITHKLCSSVNRKHTVPPPEGTSLHGTRFNGERISRAGRIAPQRVLHTKNFKEKIAEHKKLENSYKIIADWINRKIDSEQMKLCKRACDRIAKEIK